MRVASLVLLLLLASCLMPAARSMDVWVPPGHGWITNGDSTSKAKASVQDNTGAKTTVTANERASAEYGQSILGVTNPLDTSPLHIEAPAGLVPVTGVSIEARLTQQPTETGFPIARRMHAVETANLGTDYYALSPSNTSKVIVIAPEALGVTLSSGPSSGSYALEAFTATTYDVVQGTHITTTAPAAVYEIESSGEPAGDALAPTHAAGFDLVACSTAPINNQTTDLVSIVAPWEDTNVILNGVTASPVKLTKGIPVSIPILKDTYLRSESPILGMQYIINNPDPNATSESPVPTDTLPPEVTDALPPEVKDALNDIPSPTAALVNVTGENPGFISAAFMLSPPGSWTPKASIDAYQAGGSVTVATITGNIVLKTGTPILGLKAIPGSYYKCGSSPLPSGPQVIAGNTANVFVRTTIFGGLNGFLASADSEVCDPSIGGEPNDPELTVDAIADASGAPLLGAYNVTWRGYQNHQCNPVSINLLVGTHPSSMNLFGRYPPETEFVNVFVPTFCEPAYFRVVAYYASGPLYSRIIEKIPPACVGGGASGGGGSNEPYDPVPPPVVDSDLDGIMDDEDSCVGTPNDDQGDVDRDGVGDECDIDLDGDGTMNVQDNCPQSANAEQVDSDRDQRGDACDVDDDNDGILDTKDNCPTIANVRQENKDGDKLGDACDLDINGDGQVDNANAAALTPRGPDLYLTEARASTSSSRPPEQDSQASWVLWLGVGLAFLVLLIILVAARQRRRDDPDQD